MLACPILCSAPARQLRLALSSPVSLLVGAIAYNRYRADCASSNDGMIKVWELSTGKELRTLSGHVGQRVRINVDPSGRMIVSGSDDKTIKVWNLQSGKLLRTIRGHTSSVIDIAINSDEQTLASVSYDNSINVWNMHTGVLLHTLLEHRSSNREEH